jgi:hypothetical protein
MGDKSLRRKRRKRREKRKDKEKFRNMAFAGMISRKGGFHKDKRRRQKYRETYDEMLEE